MAMTSIDIQNQSFSIDRKGYDVDEVDVFLERVAQELDEMNNEITELNNAASGYGRAGRQSFDAVSDDLLAEKDEQIATLKKELKEKQADGNAIAQALIIAQRSADEITAGAKEKAEEIRQNAQDEADRILSQVEEDKQKVLDIIKELEEDREETRTEYQDMLKEFVNHATKKLSEIGGIEEKEVRSKYRAPIKKTTTPTSYSTPQTTSDIVTPSTPTPSKTEKDLSGFGAAESDFEFEELD